MAVEYIWEGFEQAFFDAETKALCRKISQIILAVEHRPFHVASSEHQAFLHKQLSNIEKLEREHSLLDFTIEKEHFSSLIQKQA